MASTYLTRTFGSAGNRQAWTWSGWIKKTTVYKSSDSNDREVWFGGYTASNNDEWLEFGTQGDVFYYTTSGISSTGNRVMRDTYGWFHAVVTYNGSNLKFYHNNTLDFDNTGLSGNRGINVAGTHTIGAVATDQSIRRFTGLMAHVHFVDGTVLTPSAFGETDSTTGIWKPILEPSVTYGTNGFFLKFENSGSMGTDSAGSNNFTVNGTMTQTIDTPSNVFATLNPIDNATAVDFTLSNGNTTLGDIGSGDNDKGLRATLGVSSGKYYWEVKKLETAGTIGILGSDVSIKDGDVVNNASSNAYNIGSNGSSSNIVYWQNGNFVNSSALQGWAANDIMGIALDMDNGKLFLSINGVFKGFDNNTSDPANGTNANFTGIATDGTIFIPYAEKRGTANPSDNYNFGNGYFGTTAVSSAGTNAGVGTFEYDVPSGYKALCTKNINAQEYS